MDIKVIHKSNAENFMEGEEHCRKYIKTDKILFGTSTLPPNSRGNKDIGHVNSHELFFVVKGVVLMYIEEQNMYHELNEGDAIVMPEGVSHTLINPGETTAVLSWSMAPPEDSNN